MDLNSVNLINLLKQKQKENPTAFPGNGSVNYFRRYEGIQEYLTNKVHRYVNAGAMLTDGGYLTDHGADHVLKVIKRTSDLVSSGNCDLTPYEVYLLLTSIQFHDVGNILGREKHGLNADKIISEMGLLAGDDTVEKKWIKDIAKAHTSDNGDKDTISKLPPNEPILGHHVRIQLLASILKLADELSDDRDRAARYLMDLKKVPKKSEIYHKFAASLHSVMIDHKGKEVSFHFAIPADDFLSQLGKGKKKVYLLDEIFERTLTTHLERIYCSRFMRPHIQLDSVSIKIIIYTNVHLEEEIDTIGYRLQEKGYPRCGKDEIYKLCPELKNWKNIKLSGNALNNLLKKKRNKQ